MYDWQRRLTCPCTAVLRLPFAHRSAAGDISISDIDLAAASGGMVLGFNAEPDETVQSHAKRLGEGGCGPCVLLAKSVALHGDRSR